MTGHFHRNCNCVPPALARPCHHPSCSPTIHNPHWQQPLLPHPLRNNWCHTAPVSCFFFFLLVFFRDFSVTQVYNRTKCENSEGVGELPNCSGYLPNQGPRVQTLFCQKHVLFCSWEAYVKKCCQECLEKYFFLSSSPFISWIPEPRVI